jgi:uncharacterized membrane protein YccF (DUF307 family)
MIVLCNILWFIFGGGLLAWLNWCLLGLLLCVTVVGIPFGMAAFRIAGFAAFPFGKQLVDVELTGGKKIIGTTFVKILWIVLAGIWLAIFHIITGVLECLTIIGIIFGLAHFKLAGVCFSPLGKRAVSTGEANLLKKNS